ncbi:hypothetical protein [Pedobacter sp. MC2016-24]|uniref:hypothetical protein n=1 Tax=Pedobacter sp. MC2016-24 TaxID=2780090 RepID=UPI00187F3666|nr:hypothetical protein [Pedobacter sp. MC2016-24]MBE9599884.1 hypothetical protein [Pedobacter sp. MC2016-24]
MNDFILSRIDRAVADNLKDIERSFGDQAGLVQDFIIFISSQIKTDLFGYTRFTVQQFCKYTGRNRQDLVMIRPEFAAGKKSAPFIEGHVFQSVFDFALYSMMERNIIFSSKYEVKANGEVIQMHNFPILKDLKLNIGRQSNEQKIYDVRVSDELLYGFLSRYYTLNSDSYRLVGKGRGGESRKKLLLYLSKLSHIMQSSETIPQIIVPLNRLCDFADISDIKPSHRKQNLIRILTYIQHVGKLLFSFEFISGNTNVEYSVKLDFQPLASQRKILMEHTFYFRLIAGLKDAFKQKYKTQPIQQDADPFQKWLADRYMDTALKARILSQAYYMALSLNINESQAAGIILTGDILQPLLAVR